MADHFEEIIGLRVSELETQVAAEAKSVKEYFAELREFITFTVTTQVTQLKAEFRRDLDGVEQRLGGRIDGLERRLDGHDRRLDGIERRLDGHDQRFDGLEQRFDGLDRKVDANHEAIKLILSDILERLPARRG